MYVCVCVCVWTSVCKDFSKSVWLQFSLFTSPSSSTSWSNNVDEGGVGGVKQSSAGSPETEIRFLFKLDTFHLEVCHFLGGKDPLTAIFLWLKDRRWTRSVKSLTSMTSVWACLVQKACGGVVQLTATKLLGFRSKAGVSRSVQAGRETHKSTLNEPRGFWNPSRGFVSTLISSHV